MAFGVAHYFIRELVFIPDQVEAMLVGIMRSAT
jgi:hypothetical protein